MPSAKRSRVCGVRSAEMSAMASADAREVMAWYSACTTSGAPFPARTAVSSLVTAASPASCRLTTTCTSGFCWFQRSTTSSMPGAQAQKVSSIGVPPGVAPQPGRAGPAQAAVVGAVRGSGAVVRPAPVVRNRRRVGPWLLGGVLAGGMHASLQCVVCSWVEHWCRDRMTVIVPGQLPCGSPPGLPRYGVMTRERSLSTPLPPSLRGPGANTSSSPIPGLDGLAFGADYNPEQWPREVWHEDVHLMREAGVTMVTIGMWSWSKLEPREGEFDTGWR